MFGMIYYFTAVIAAFAFIAALSPVIMLIAGIFDRFIWWEFFQDGRWKGALRISLIGWIVFILCGGIAYLVSNRM